MATREHCSAPDDLRELLHKLADTVDVLAMQLANISDQIEAVDKRSAETLREVAEISRDLWIQCIQKRS